MWTFGGRWRPWGVGKPSGRRAEGVEARREAGSRHSEARSERDRAPEGLL